MLDPGKIKAMKEQLKTGVAVVSAPQLFPTPPDVARKLVRMAKIRPEHHLLEPSAGTGALLDALRLTHLSWGGFFKSQPVAVELNVALANMLKEKYPWCEVIQGDFLDYETTRTFDRVVMNPPFKDGIDIAHIWHAYKFLNPRGRLVAICAAGSRQQKAFNFHAAPHCFESWEALPDNTFEGTGVRSAIVVLNRPGRD